MRQVGNQLLSVKTNHSINILQLGLGGLEGRGKQVAHVACGLVEVEAHAIAAETLGNNVKVDAGTSRSVFTRL